MWVVLLAAGLVSGCGYDRIQELGERAAEARAAIEVQLQRRTELVPALVETVVERGEASEEAITAVVDSRIALAAAVRGDDLAALDSASAFLSGALSRLMSEAEREATLQADPAFQLLRSQLMGTEEQISEAARSYNEAVRLHNDYIARFPQVITAKIVGARPLRQFRSSSAETSATGES
ncbi:MAG: LemA family protein [Gemmatimonadota bacterium]|nr:MAG: LemA family protein [Gemmatimonadota bacterium]